MEAEEDDDDEFYRENWEDHLTPRLGAHFKRTGRYLVEQQILHGKYRGREKKLAAMAWLAEQRRSDRTWTVAGVVFALVLPVVTAIGGAYYGATLSFDKAVELQARESAERRNTLVKAFSGDIESLVRLETDRFERLSPALAKLVTMDSLRQGGGRPWLMPAAESRFPVFEQNASQLGTLGEKTATDLAVFYGLSYELRSRINLAISPAILAANADERRLAVDDYRDTLEKWQASAAEIQLILSDRWS